MVDLRARSRGFSLVLALSALTLSSGVSTAQCGDELFKLESSDLASGDLFGGSLALDGALAVISAVGDGNPPTGSAYVFNVMTGAQLHKLTANDADSWESFGHSSAISGPHVVIGAHTDDDQGIDSGSAYYFNAVTGQQQWKILPLDGGTDDDFGWSVAIDGTLAVVGAPSAGTMGVRSGSAYLFDTAAKVQRRKLLASDREEWDGFGASVGIHGTRILVGAPNDDGVSGNIPQSGCVYVFDLVTGAELAILRPNDPAEGAFFGRSLAVSDDLAIVSAPGTFGNFGSAYVFDLTTGMQTFKLAPEEDDGTIYYGDSVAIDGTTAAVGAPRATGQTEGCGAVFLFDCTTGAQIAKFVASDGETSDRLGGEVALSGPRVLSGAMGDSDAGSNSGAAYVFDTSLQVYRYCDANPSSLGQSAEVSGCGSTSLVANEFSLIAAPVPGTPYLFFHGDIAMNVPFGDGFRCAGGNVLRLGPAQISTGGVAQKSLDLPSAGINTTGTFYFQCWFRDTAAGGAGFNLSNGLAATFTP